MLERRVSARMPSIRTCRKMGTVDGGGECGPGQWVCMGLWTNPRVYVHGSVDVLIAHLWGIEGLVLSVH